MKLLMNYLCGLLLTIGAPLLASGFGLYEQGIQGQGGAGAFVARAEDGSALYYNPAGLANLQFDEISVAGRSISSRSFYSNAGQTRWRADLSVEASPVLFYNKQFAKFGVAIGTTTTFHQDLDWDQADYPGRFLANHSTFNVDEYLVGMGYRFTDTFSAGLTLRHAKLDYELGKSVPRPYLTSNPGAYYESDELYVTDGTGSGYTLGFQYHRSRGFNIGVSYQSAIEIDTTGTRSFIQTTELDDPRATSHFQSHFPSSDLNSSFELPDRIAIGVSSPITVRTRLELDVTQEGWSSVKETRFDLEGAHGTVIIPRDWDDSNSIRIMGDFQQRRSLLWRVGMATMAEIVGEDTLNPDFPDNRRFLYSFGVSYTMKKRYTLDAGWSLIQTRDRFTTDKELVFDPTAPGYVRSNGQGGLLESQNFSIQLGLRIRLGDLQGK